MGHLRILSYNVKLIPPYAKLAIRPGLCTNGWWEDGGGRWSDGERSKRIEAMLVRSGADVIVLQELFQEGARARFREALAAVGYSFSTGPLGTGVLSEDSGLFVASRVPIVEHAFEEFDAKAGEDALSDKGIAHAVVDVSERWPGIDHLELFGVHLQSGYAQHAVRKKQLGQLASYVGRRVTQAKRDRTAVATLGDFNVVGEAPDQVQPSWEYEQLLRILRGAEDLGKPGEFTWDGVVNEWMTQEDDESRKRLDYIFAFESVLALGSVRALTATARIDPFLSDGRHLSDHFAVVADLTPAL
ncbi:MAG: sphingomyelin phosphodiesterase [Myxococcota bacterium]